jgi:hypothetical protein
MLGILAIFKNLSQTIRGFSRDFGGKSSGIFTKNEILQT